MFTDQDRRRIHDAVRRREHHLFSHLLSPDLFLQAASNCGLQIVCSPLNLVNHVWLALCCALSPDSSFSSILSAPFDSLSDDERFAASQLNDDISRSNQRRCKRSSCKHKHNGRCPDHQSHNPRCGSVETVSPSAFFQARLGMPLEFWVALLVLLVQRFEQEHADVIRWGRFRLMALDGTRLSLADYPALRQHFGTANNGGGTHNAQARMVLLSFPLARFPLAYSLQPVKIGEPTMARQLLRGLRKDDLVLLDAGFRSYGVLAQIHDQDAFFCLRLGQKLGLRVIKQLSGNNDVLVEWQPKDSRGKWRKEGLPKSIRMRRLTYEAKGFRPLVLLTNVLSAEEVPYEKWWGLTLSEEGEVLARGIYNFRWEIEVTYRELKVEQSLEGGLRSRTAQGVEYEVAGHVLLYLLVRWLLVEAAQKAKVSPLRLSYHAALEEVKKMRQAALVASEEWVKDALLPRLKERMGSNVVKERPGRNYPRKARQRRASKRANTAKFRRQQKARASRNKKTNRKHKTKDRRWFGYGWNLQGRIIGPPA